MTHEFIPNNITFVFGRSWVMHKYGALTRGVNVSSLYLYPIQHCMTPLMLKCPLTCLIVDPQIYVVPNRLILTIQCDKAMYLFCAVSHCLYLQGKEARHLPYKCCWMGTCHFWFLVVLDLYHCKNLPADFVVIFQMASLQKYYTCE